MRDRNGRPFPCTEFTMDVDFGPRTVRVWIDARESLSTARAQADQLFLRIRDLPAVADDEELLQRIAEHYYVNAVQIVHNVGPVRFGAMVYTVEF